MPTDIHLDELDLLLAESAPLIEVRPGGDYYEEHLPDAVSSWSRSGRRAR